MEWKLKVCQKCLKIPPKRSWSHLLSKSALSWSLNVWRPTLSPSASVGHLHEKTFQQETFQKLKFARKQLQFFANLKVVFLRPFRQAEYVLWYLVPGLILPEHIFLFSVGGSLFVLQCILHFGLILHIDIWCEILVFCFCWVFVCFTFLHSYFLCISDGDHLDDNIHMIVTSLVVLVKIIMITKIMIIAVTMTVTSCPCCSSLDSREQGREQPERRRRRRSPIQEPKRTPCASCYLAAVVPLRLSSNTHVISETISLPNFVLKFIVH